MIFHQASARLRQAANRGSRRENKAGFKPTDETPEKKFCIPCSHSVNYHC